MFAIVRSGGKQYRVAADAELVVDRLHAEVGARIDLETLLLGDGADLSQGTVAAEVIAHVRGDKIIIFKKKRRHNYRRKNGHRSELTVLRIFGFGGENTDEHAAAALSAPQTTGAPATAPTEATHGA
jgi:large subunit ribosomal protein L21